MEVFQCVVDEVDVPVDHSTAGEALELAEPVTLVPIRADPFGIKMDGQI